MLENEETLDNTGPPTADSYNEALYSLTERITELRNSSVATLAVICALILMGALVFWFASRISSQDIAHKPDLIEKKNSAVHELANIYPEAQEISKEIVEEGRTFNEEIIELARKSFKRSEFVNYNSGGDIRQATSFGQVDTKYVVESIKTQLMQLKGKKDDFKGTIGQDNNLISITANFDEWTKFLDNLIVMKSTVDPNRNRELNEKFGKIQEKQTYLNDYISSINKVVIDSDLNTNNNNDLNTSSWPKIIQTNITRFGTLLMITFLVAILIPLYRYNRRLQGFYEARRDALMLMQTNLSEIGFEKLCLVLTPQIDFGRLPQTPIEQVIELIKTASAKGGEIAK